MCDDNDYCEVGNVYNLSEGGLSKLANRVKEMVVTDLVKSELISQEQGEEYLKTKVVISYKPSWFGKMWRKLSGYNNAENNITLSIVKLEIKQE